jgi:hypothetical protein
VVSQYDTPAALIRSWRRSGRSALLGALSLMLLACATPSERDGDAGRNNGSWAGIPIGTAPPANARLKHAIVTRAQREWEFFGRQTVLLQGSEESIPHVGAWEDDGDRYSSRVNAYWRTVKEPQLTGMDCSQPWSAAFISWVMQAAGVPAAQFPPASAHSTYLAAIVENAEAPRRWFVPRRLSDYSPQPGDLICASRGKSRPRIVNGYVSARALAGMKGHCDLVVGGGAKKLEVIGGNVRNSVSKTTLELDGKGRLQPSAKRPWFIVIENRL